MIISGNGMTESLDVKIVRYKFDIDLSLKWFEMGDGSWKASDRGHANDHIVTELRFHGKKDYINNIINQLKLNQEDNGILTLSSIEEPIFGPHVDYTSTISSVLELIDIKEQKSLNGFRLDIVLRSATMEFNDYSLTLPSLDAVEHSYVGGTEWSFDIVPTYTNLHSGNLGSIDINRFGEDRGKFEATIKFTYDEFAQLLHFQRVNRTLPFEMPDICGIPQPFGVLAGSAPYQAKLYNITNIKRISPQLWSAKVVFVQDF